MITLIFRNSYFLNIFGYMIISLQVTCQASVFQ